MLTYERKEKIIEILKENTTATVDSLCKKLYSSGSTIRRDLAELEADGLIMRVRGGATILSSKNSDKPLLLRVNVNRSAKEIIARQALKYIKKGSTIFFDSSSTVCFLAELLDSKLGLTIITNGIPTLSVLSEIGGFNVICTGGTIKNGSALIGSRTVKAIENYTVDYAFISCCGVSETGVITETVEENSYIKRAMISGAKVKILLCDHSKFGLHFFSSTCTTKDINLIITDKALPSELLNNLGCTVIWP